MKFVGDRWDVPGKLGAVLEVDHMYIFKHFVGRSGTDPCFICDHFTILGIAEDPDMSGGGWTRGGAAACRIE